MWDRSWVAAAIRFHGAAAQDFAGLDLDETYGRKVGAGSLVTPQAHRYPNPSRRGC
jgi:hypothetical protein